MALAHGSGVSRSQMTDAWRGSIRITSSYLTSQMDRTRRCFRFSLISSLSDSSASTIHRATQSATAIVAAGFVHTIWRALAHLALAFKAERAVSTSATQPTTAIIATDRHPTLGDTYRRTPHRCVYRVASLPLGPGNPRTPGLSLGPRRLSATIRLNVPIRRTGTAYQEENKKTAPECGTFLHGIPPFVRQHKSRPLLSRIEAFRKRIECKWTELERGKRESYPDGLSRSHLLPVAEPHGLAAFSWRALWGGMTLLARRGGFRRRFLSPLFSFHLACDPTDRFLYGSKKHRASPGNGTKYTRRDLGVVEKSRLRGTKRPANQAQEIS